MNKHEVLKQYFGHSIFRNGQEKLIDAVLSGQDALGIMPTGGGKSLCYQVPALIFEGVTFIISPLISLMKDQVMALKDAGINAAFINSSLSSDQLYDVYNNIRANKYKLIYVAPERLSNEAFISLAKKLNISFVAVDEAHCISQWGQDFRPSYLRILEFLDKLNTRPVLAAFTATATSQVREDIKRILKLDNPCCVMTGFDRPNLSYEVLCPKNKPATLKLLIEQRKGKSGIIYCSTRKNVDEICNSLSSSGVLATKYHAGLSDEERKKNQEDFLYDRSPVIVATNAFGMGIDKSNVSFVIHYNMPKSPEAYYQEAGRAGRDGEKADCILLYSAGDIQTAKHFIQSNNDNSELSYKEKEAIMKQDLERLDTMIGYCKTHTCLRGYILDYFGQEHTENCGNCLNCKTSFSQADITKEAQMILSCIKRAHDKLGYSIGITTIINALRGSSEQKVLKSGLNELTTYGLMKSYTTAQIKEYTDFLLSNEYLTTDPNHGGTLLTLKSGNVLFKGEKLFMLSRDKQPIEKQTKKAKSQAPLSVDSDNELLSALKSLRFRLAQEEKIPAYIIFSNASLVDMTAKMPVSIPEFLEVTGVGEIKAEKYGEVFIKEIKKYAERETE